MRIFGLVNARRRRSYQTRPASAGWPRMRHRLRTSVPAVLVGGVYLALPLGAALADDTAEDLKQLRAAIQRELADLKKRAPQANPKVASDLLVKMLG